MPPVPRKFLLLGAVLAYLVASTFVPWMPSVGTLYSVYQQVEPLIEMLSQ